MIHLYFGDGKGKTTAACGLALRASQSDMKVLFAQFFKNGKSGEVKALSGIPSVEVKVPSLFYGRYKNMSDEQKEEIRNCYTLFSKKIISMSVDYDLIVLDEAVSVYKYGLIDRAELIAFLKAEKGKKEIVLTGRSPSQELLDVADYITEMRKVKHPYDKGIQARKGIEF